MLYNIKKEISRIVKLISDKELVFFVGAGVSIAPPSSLPGFQNLQNEIIKALYEDLRGVNGRENSKLLKKDTEVLNNLIPEILFQVCKEEVPSDKKNYAIEPLKIFRKGKPNQNHAFLAAILSEGLVPAILTTNFDNLIEKTLKNQLGDVKYNKKVRIYWRSKHFLSAKNEISIVKLHGCVSELDSIVIALDDIGKRCTSTKINILKYFLENYYVLFTGYRGADLDIYSCLVTTKCKGIFWNTLSEKSLIPKIRRLLNVRKGKILVGDLNELLVRLAEKLQIRIEKQDYKIKTPDMSKIIYSWTRGIETYIKVIIMGDLFEYVGRWEKALEFFNIGIKEAEKRNNKELEALFLSKMSAIHYKGQEYEKARDLCNKVLKITEHFDLPLKLNNKVAMLQIIGLTCIHEGGKIKAAFDYLQRALKYQEKLEKINEKSRYHKAEVLSNIGNTLYLGGLMQEALKYYSRCLKVFDEFGDVHGRACTLANVGNIYLKQKELDRSMRCYKEAEHLFIETRDFYEIPKISFNLAIINHKKNRNEKAVVYAKKAFEFYEIIGDREGAIEASNLLEKVQ